MRRVEKRHKKERTYSLRIDPRTLKHLKDRAYNQEESLNLYLNKVLKEHVRCTDKKGDVVSVEGS